LVVFLTNSFFKKASIYLPVSWQQKKKHTFFGGQELTEIKYVFMSD